jgi:hypothetical protein
MQVQQIVKSNHLYGKLMNREITLAIVLALVFSLAVVATTFAMQAYAAKSNSNSSHGNTIKGPGRISSFGHGNGGDARPSTNGKSLVNSAGFGIAG